MEILQGFDADRLRGLRERGEFFWLDLTGANADDMRALGEYVPIHPMALEDTEEFGQRAKLDDYSDSALLVFFGVEPNADGPDRLVEVHLHMSDAALVTVPRTPLTAISAARERIGADPSDRHGHAICRVLDALADSFLDALDGFDDTIDELQEALVQRATTAHRQRIFHLRRQLTRMHQVAVPQRELLSSGDDFADVIPGLDNNRDRNRLRDIHDHLTRATELIDAYRDQLDSLLDLYITETSNRLNAFMGRLTVIATVFLPLSFLTGFFGMNFDWLLKALIPEWTFWVFGLGLMLLSGALVAWYLRRNAK